jgi:exopolysaccharide biosynthesis protein
MTAYITRGRHPRAALAATDEGLLLVAVDDRTGRDAGMTLPEPACASVKLGAADALTWMAAGPRSWSMTGGCATVRVRSTALICWGDARW